MDMLQLARKDALALTRDDPGLTSPANCYIKGIIQKRYPTYLANVKGG